MPASAAGFLESRLLSLQLLPAQIDFVLMLQEDFLVDRIPSYEHLKEALQILRSDNNIASLRLMPCPGPHSEDPSYQLPTPLGGGTENSAWKVLGEKDEYLFTYQATIWRRSVIADFYQQVLINLCRQFPIESQTPEGCNWLALKMNCAECSWGQTLLRRCTKGWQHLAWQRTGTWANAVYLCPFPYRPTAIVKGQIMPFAQELAQREGVPLEELGVSARS